MEEKTTFRQYDIMIAAKEFVTANSATEAEERAFIAGAEWSDKNPDIPTIWHDRDSKPMGGSSMVLAITFNGFPFVGFYENGKSMDYNGTEEGVYRGDKYLISWDYIDRWAYVDMIKNYIK